MAKRLGELLIEAKVITQEQLDHVLGVQRQDGRKIGQLLIELKMVGEITLTQTLSRQLAVPWVSLYHIEFSRSLLNLVPRELAERFCLVPIFLRKVRKQGDALYVAMDDPTNEPALAEASRVASMQVKPMIACPSDIRSAIRVHYQGGAPGSAPRVPVAAPSSPSASRMAAAPPSAASVLRHVVVPAAAPPLPERASRVDEREKQPTLPEGKEGVLFDTIDDANPLDSPKPPSVERLNEDQDHPDATPEIESREIDAPRSSRGSRGPRMVGLTLLDGTTIMLPAKPRPARPEGAPGTGAPGTEAPREDANQLTARDLISALRATAHGADATEILGEKPPTWEAMFAALLSLMLKKGLIADWEFIDEFRKV